MSHAALVRKAIDHSIRRIRGHNVMLDSDLARLYGVETRTLNQAVTRNAARFPPDFMFRLSADEARFLRSQIVILRAKPGGHPKYRPRAFTEQGVAMLSSVLRSQRAIIVNVEIMRAFVALRRMLASNIELAHKLDELEHKYDAKFRIVFEAIRELMAPRERPRRPIGFK